VKGPHDFLVRKPTSQLSDSAKPVQIMEMNNVCSLECCIEIPTQPVSHERNWRIEALLSDHELVETRSHRVDWSREGF